MAERTCSVDGCTMPTKARGWCSAHYARWKRSGEVGEAVPVWRPVPVAVRFWAKVGRRGEGDCWLWRGAPNQNGYGVFFVDGKLWPAHRYSLHLSSPCPDESLFACHHCDNPPCVNPAHLYWGTPADNHRDMVERGRASGGRAKKDHCPNGHPYTLPPQGKRGRCEVCQAANLRRKNEKKRRRYQALRAYGFHPQVANVLKVNSRFDALIGFDAVPTEVEP